MFDFIKKIEVKIVSLLSGFAKKFNIETDKFAHMICAFVITLLLGLIYNINIAVISTLIISVAKEIYDMYKPNSTGFSLDDIKYDVYGIFFGVVLISLFYLL